MSAAMRPRPSNHHARSPLKVFHDCSTLCLDDACLLHPSLDNLNLNTCKLGPARRRVEVAELNATSSKAVPQLLSASSRAKSIIVGMVHGKLAAATLFILCEAVRSI